MGATDLSDVSFCFWNYSCAFFCCQ